MQQPVKIALGDPYRHVLGLNTCGKKPNLNEKLEYFKEIQLKLPSARQFNTDKKLCRKTDGDLFESNVGDNLAYSKRSSDHPAV